MSSTLPPQTDSSTQSWLKRNLCPKCSLKRKAWYLASGVLLLLAVFLAVGINIVLRGSYGMLEQRGAEEAARRIERCLVMELDSLERSARDYAVWTDTWSAVARSSLEYANVNMGASAFTNLHLHAFLLFHLDGRLSLGRVYDSDLAQLSPAAAAEWEPLFGPWARMVSNDHPRDVRRGLVRHDQRLLIFAILPITKDDGAGTVNGALVQARVLDQGVLAQWRDVTGLQLSMREPDRDGSRPWTERFRSIVVDENTLEIQVPLRLGDESIGSVITATVPREIQQQRQHALHWFYVMLVVLVAAALVLIVQLLHSLVLARLQSLYDGIRRVRDTSDLSVRFPCAGDDEVARLAQAANHMLEALEQSESARKMDERERDMLKSQLQQAQKREAIGTMAGGIALDFNYLLSGILCTAGLMRLDLPEGHPLLEHINRIELAGTSASTLIRQMLTFSRVQPVKFEKVRLGDVVSDVLQLLRAGLPRTIELRFRNEAVEDTVQADVSQLQQVIMNFATNSSHAMAGMPNGEFCVTISEVGLPDPARPETAHLPPGPYVRMDVADTGGGIPIEILDRIFDPFFTTKPVGTGTGLGLAVVHGIVAKHHGSVGVESEPGKGTHFYIHLPKVPSPKRADSGTTPSSTPLVPVCIRVLLVDDDHLVRETIARGLKRMGHEVTPVPSGDAALKILEDEHQEFDLLLSDQLMPGMTGLQLGERAAALRPGLPMVLMSGFAASLNEETVLSKGFQALLMKPVTMDQLRLILLALQSRHS